MKLIMPGATVLAMFICTGCLAYWIGIVAYYRDVPSVVGLVFSAVILTPIYISLVRKSFLIVGSRIRTPSGPWIEVDSVLKVVPYGDDHFKLALMDGSTVFFTVYAGTPWGYASVLRCVSKHCRAPIEDDMREPVDPDNPPPPRHAR